MSKSRKSAGAVDEVPVVPKVLLWDNYQINKIGGQPRIKTITSEYKTASNKK